MGWASKNVPWGGGGGGCNALEVCGTCALEHILTCALTHSHILCNKYWTDLSACHIFNQNNSRKKNNQKLYILMSVIAI